MYRGSELTTASTIEWHAVGLEDPNIFQSYIICSEYGTDTTAENEESLRSHVNNTRQDGSAPQNENLRKTRLTYGKVAAGA